MNKAILMGRLTRDPEIRYTQGEDQMCIARYTLAFDRRSKEREADFISIVAFGRVATFAEKYFRKRTKVIVTGRIQTGSYLNRAGEKIYTTDIIAEDQEFAESKASGQAQQGNVPAAADGYPKDNNGYINIPDGIDEELPFT